MALRTILMRVSAIGLGLAGGGVYAASSGLIAVPGFGPQDTPPAAQAALLPPPPPAGADGQPALLAMRTAAATAPLPGTPGAPAAGTDAGTPVPVALTETPGFGAPDAVAAAPVPLGPAPLQAAPPAPVPLAPIPLDTAGMPEPLRPALPERPERLAALDAPEDAPMPVPMPMPEATPRAGTGDMPMELSPLGLPCGLTVTASAMEPALIALDVMDPCLTGAEVQVEHSGLTIAARTDGFGLMSMDLPAFESPAFVTVTLPGGITESVLVEVPDLDAVDRVGVTWQGPAALDLHAFERDAAFGAPGHVHAAAPGDVAAVLDGTGGLLQVLGDPDLPMPRLAQVYTFPTDTLAEGDAVALSIDAPITEANCGLPAAAVTLRRSLAGPVEITDLAFTTPGCDAVGDILVLQNLLGPLRLAAN